jgi:hypothetical protein
MGGADMTGNSADIAASGARQNPSERTGCSRGKALHVSVSDGISDRPMSIAWITDDLLRYTREVWSKAYGREVAEDEAIEMLVNVKRLAEVMLKVAERKGDDADECGDMGAGLIP